MYVFHEGFDVSFWDFEFGKFVYAVFMYSSSYFDCDANKGVGPPSIFCMVSISGVVFGVFAHEGLFRESAVNSISCVVCAREGHIGVCVWFGAPSMHKKDGLTLAWHWHFVYGHMHLRNHYGIVWSCC